MSIWNTPLRPKEALKALFAMLECLFMDHDAVEKERSTLEMTGRVRYLRCRACGRVARYYEPRFGASYLGPWSPSAWQYFLRALLGERTHA